jgi:hypothetical protein
VPTVPLSDADLLATVSAYRRLGSQSKVGEEFGKTTRTVQRHLREATARGLLGNREITHEPPPEADLSIEEILARARLQAERRAAQREYERIHTIHVRRRGPIGLVPFGDPHLDSPDCEFNVLERIVKLILDTPGMYATNAGDTTDNWTAKLAGLYAHSRNSKGDSGRLTEWFINVLKERWLVWVLGNHDVWNGGDDLLMALCERAGVWPSVWSARVELTFPGTERTCRINHKHGYSGHSMYNPGHGIRKEQLFGQRDHIYFGGHIHTSWLQGPMVDPNTNEWSWGFQLGSFKKEAPTEFDRRNCPAPWQNAFPAAAVIIDPEAEDEAEFLTPYASVKTACRALNELRRSKGYLE